MTITVNKLIIGIVVILLGASVALGAKVFTTPPGSGAGSLGNTSHGNLQAQAVQQRDEEKVKPAPAFTLESLDGSTISLADYKGEKAVVLDFWASWCPNCRRDMPKMNVMYPKFKDDVEIIAVNMQETKNTVKQFVESQGFDYPIVLDPTGRTAQSYGINYTNTHVLINREGNIVAVIPGDITEEVFQALIDA